MSFPMASLDPSESGTVRLYPKVPSKQQNGHPGRVWSKEHQNSSVLCSPPKGKIHTGEYSSLLRIKLNSNFLQVEAKAKGKLWSTASCDTTWQLLFENLHLIFLQTVPPTEGSWSTVCFSSILCWSPAFIFFCLVIQHLSEAKMQFWPHEKCLRGCICKVHLSYTILSSLLMESPTAHAFTEYHHFFLKHKRVHQYFKTSNNKVVLWWEQYPITYTWPLHFSLELQATSHECGHIFCWVLPSSFLTNVT